MSQNSETEIDPTDPTSRVALSGRICVAVSGKTPAELLQRSTSLLPEFPFQELRLDTLHEPESISSALQAHMAMHRGATFLATCRRNASGGHFAGSPEAEHNVLTEAIHAGCSLVDLSIESAEMLSHGCVAQLQAAGAAVLLSWHDFERTGDLHTVLERMRPFAPDFAKIVPTAQRLHDNLALFQLLHNEAGKQDIRVVGLAMGQAGLVSRVLGVRAGSAFTFAAPDAAAATAPGQLNARTLRDLYRVDQIGADTRIYGVAGDPVASSISPAMLNTAFEHASVDAVYVPLLTHDPQELFTVARDLPLAGFSVTMPLKQAVLPFLQFIDPLARKIGAVNTVRRESDGSFSGFNTDVAGIIGPLEARLSLSGARILVLGAGGAARAAVFGCMDRGAHVFILNRSHEKAIALAAESGATAVRHKQIAELPIFDAIVHATPAGMRGNATELPLAPDELRTKLVFDMVYNPQNTPLLRAAQACGLATIPGVEMFVRQGAQQFKLWTGKPAPMDAMREVVLRALTKSGNT